MCTDLWRVFVCVCVCDREREDTARGRVVVKEALSARMAQN